MSNRPDHMTDELITQFLRARTADPDAALLNDIVRTVEATPQERPSLGLRLIPLGGWKAPMMTRFVTFGLGAAAVVVALFVGAQLLGTPGNVGSGGEPTPTPEPSAVPQVDWTGPLRPDSETMPLVSVDGYPYRWADAQDADVDWVDIEAVRGPQRQEWVLDLAGIPPQASTLDPTERVIEYGVVVDATADGVADCLIGINNDAPEPGDFRAWVTNLGTGETTEQVGPPYGLPIDFFHPDEQSGETRSMRFFFVFDPAPCDPFTGSVRLYAWASLTESGRVTAWDYAPNAAWLYVPEPGDQP